MPKKKNYPKWFSQYSKPRFYQTEPSKELVNNIVLEKRTLSNYSEIDINTIPVGTELIKLEALGDDEIYGTEIEINFIKLETVPNPKYEKLLKDYEAAKDKHKEDVKQWKFWKKKWDEEQEKENEEYEKRYYQKLKKKFETN